MEYSSHTRRRLFGLVATTVMALTILNSAQAGVLPGAKMTYQISLISLIPHAAKAKRDAFLHVKYGERVAVRRYLDLPLVVEIQPCPADVRERQAQAEKRMPSLHIAGCSTIRLLDERGREIKEMNIGDATTAMFVDQRLAVFLSEAT